MNYKLSINSIPHSTLNIKHSDFAFLNKSLSSYPFGHGRLTAERITVQHLIATDFDNGMMQRVTIVEDNFMKSQSADCTFFHGLSGYGSAQFALGHQGGRGRPKGLPLTGRIAREAVGLDFHYGLLLTGMHAEEPDSTDNHQLECRGVLSRTLTSAEHEEASDFLDA